MARGLLIVPSERYAAQMADLLPELSVRTAWEAGPWSFILRFGDTSGKDDAEVVLNRLSALTAEDNEARWRQCWQASRVRQVSPGRRVRFYRRYRVHLFDLRPVYMQRLEIGNRRVQRVSPTATKEAREVADLATRALYSAGFDIGSVDIGLSSKGNLYAITCDPSPRLSRRIVAAYATQIRTWVQRLESRYSSALIAGIREGKTAACPRYLMGADPEFMMYDSRTRRMVFSSDYFPMNGLVGCDARRVRVGRSGYPLAEVRPRPAQCPVELTENIRLALVRAANLAPYRNIQWRAGTLPFRQLPVGGHIHFSMQPSGPILRALDSYLGVMFLMVENQGAARARRAKYGWLGDYRIKNHGGFEYRVLPSWLVSPAYTRAALCLAKVIGCEWPRLRHDFFLQPEAQTAFRRADRSCFQPELEKLMDELRSLGSYEKYAEHIEPFFEYILENRSWKTSGDLRRAWGLRISRRVKG
ncbi:MAG: putative amidoligase domain-containing protein [Bacillota bacterium]